jgi:putative ABC transport system permease protein
VIATLGLGIGACTVIFSTFDTLVRRATDDPEPARRVFLHETRLPRQPQLEVSVQTFYDWERQATAIEHLTASASGAAILRTEGEPLRLTSRLVTIGAFKLGSDRLALGRAFLPEDYELKRAMHPLILGHGLWQRMFGGSREVLGRTLNLDGRLWTVVGVWTERPGGVGADIDVCLPLLMPPNDAQGNRRDRRMLSVEGRLKEGVSLEQAQAELDLIAARMAQEYPDTNDGVGARIRPWLNYVNRDIMPRLWLLSAAVGCLLLLACANVANLLLARATVRQRELSVRAALGASRGRLVRQMLVESVVLAVLGGALGVLLAHWGLQAVRAVGPYAGLDPRLAGADLNGCVLLFSLGFSIATGIAFGSVPAWLGSRTDLNDALKLGMRSATEGRSRGRLRSALIVFEVAVAVLLVASAGVFLRSFTRLAQHDAGVRAGHLAALKQPLAAQKYARPEARAAFADALLEKLARLPQVEAAAYASQLPFNLTRPTPFTIQGTTEGGSSERPTAVIGAVSPMYFQTMGIPLLRGRGFTEQDHARSVPVCLVSSAFAQQHFAHEDPIGRRINVDNRMDAWREIIGVVADVMQFSPRRAITGQVYLPMAQRGYGMEFFVVRTTGDPRAVLPLFKQQVQAVDKDEVVGPVRTLPEWIADRFVNDRLTSDLLNVFAGLALLLAAIGVYAVLAYSVAQRTAEIGIRMALGASRSEVVRLVLQRGMGVALTGIAIGLGAMLAFGQLLESLLFKTTARDPLTLSVVVGLLFGVSVVACLLPAWRAAKVDPMTALRAE